MGAMPWWCRWLGAALLAGEGARLLLVTLSNAPTYLPLRDLWPDVAITVLSVGALMARAVRERREEGGNGAPWACWAAGIATFELGNALWYLHVQYVRPVPYPSVADGAWLGFYPLVLGGLAVLTYRLRPTLDALLDGLIVGLAAASLLTAAFLSPLLALTGADLAHRAVTPLPRRST